MEKLIEAIKNKDIVKAKKIFNGLMEDVKTNLVEEERKIVSKSFFEVNNLNHLNFNIFFKSVVSQQL